MFQQVFGPGTIGQRTSSLPVGKNFTYMSGDTALESWVPATTLITASGSNVYGVPVNGYVFAPTTTTMSGRATSSSDDTSALTNAPTSGSTSVPARIGLSSGEKAGIGVGVTLAILGLRTLLVAWFLIRQHRRKALNTDGLTNNFSRVPLHGLSVEEGSVYEMGVPLKTPKESL